MSEQGLRLAAAARALAGVPFRLYGRDPATGLDCIGLVLAALRSCQVAGPPLPPYALRNRDIAGLEAQAANWGLARRPLPGIADPPEAGDIVLARPGPAQHHLLVALGANACVHAHAGLGRVVVQALSDWPLAGRWHPRPF